jgi:hypothetical protein
MPVHRTKKAGNARPFTPSTGVAWTCHHAAKAEPSQHLADAALGADCTNLDGPCHCPCFCEHDRLSQHFSKLLMRANPVDLWYGGSSPHSVGHNAFICAILAGLSGSARQRPRAMLVYLGERAPAHFEILKHESSLHSAHADDSQPEGGPLQMCSPAPRRRVSWVTLP